MINSIPSSAAEKKDRLNIYNISIYLSLIGSFFIFIGDPYKISNIVSIGTKIIILTNLLCVTLYLINNFKNNKDSKFILPTILIIITTLLAYIVSGISSPYNSIVSMLGFWSIPFYFLYYREITNLIKIKNIIYISYILLSFIYIYLSFSSLSHIGYSTWRTYKGELSLGYNNPNETGMYLFICFIVLLSAVKFYNKKTIKLLLYADSAYLFYLLYETNARSSFIAALFVLIFTLFKLADKINRKHINFIMIIPFIFVLLNMVYTQWLSSINIFGSTAASGRLYVFNEYFKNLNILNFIFGDFNVYHFGNLHNAYISVISTIGIIGFILYFSFIKNMILWFINQKNISNYAYISLLGIIGVIIQSSAEAAFLVTGVVFANSVGMLMLLSISDNNNNNLIKKQKFVLSHQKHGVNLLRKPIKTSGLL